MVKAIFFWIKAGDRLKSIEIGNLVAARSLKCYVSCMELKEQEVEPAGKEPHAATIYLPAEMSARKTFL